MFAQGSKKSIQISKNAMGYLFVSPLIIGLGLFMAYPLLDSIRMSFFKIELMNIRLATFIGIKNFVRMFTSTEPSFWGDTMRITVIFVGACVVLQVGIGLGLALLLNFKWLKGRIIFRNIFLLPWITAGVICGYSWRFVYNSSTGVLNYLLSLVGIAPQAWLSNPNLVMLSIIIANIWKGTTYSVLIQTAGLQSIPDEIYEAAYTDGASPWQSLIHITLPLLAPFLFINLLTETGDTFNAFDRIYAMTRGGPLHSTEILSIYTYRQAFVHGDLGIGAAAGLFQIIIGLILAIIYLRAFRLRAY